MDAMIQVKDLQKTYHMGEIDVPALRRVSFTIGRGEFVAIMGPSGSGKIHADELAWLPRHARQRPVQLGWSFG